MFIPKAELLFVAAPTEGVPVEIESRSRHEKIAKREREYRAPNFSKHVGKLKVQYIQSMGVFLCVLKKMKK